MRAFLVVTGIAALLGCSAAWAQNYPSKPIRFILPFPPGGGTDTLARIVGQRLGENLGQTMVLDNRPGAGANIGAEIGAHSVPDGYTLTMGNVAHAINMTLYAKPGYDLARDFAPITLLAVDPEHPGRASVGRGQIGAGIDRARQSQAGPAQLRIIRQRQFGASRRRTFQEHGRRESHARSIQRRRPGGDEPGRRRNGRRLRNRAIGAAADQVQPAARARGHHA